MRISKRNIERRTVVEAYARYDCSKKGHSTPDFATWDWTQADAIDRQMKCAQLKCGVPAGYLLWDEVEITMLDLRRCAVVAQFFPGKPRALGILKDDGELVAKPKPERSWYRRVSTGESLNESDPLLQRPAVRGEFPACYYIEDGSGRATTLVANEALFDPSQILAIGFIGRSPDQSSSFMQRHLRELLRN